jgi:hypothetical protein
VKILAELVVREGLDEDATVGFAGERMVEARRYFGEQARAL